MVFMFTYLPFACLNHPHSVGFGRGAGDSVDRDLDTFCSGRGAADDILGIGTFVAVVGCIGAVKKGRGGGGGTEKGGGGGGGAEIGGGGGGGGTIKIGVLEWVVGNGGCAAVSSSVEDTCDLVFGWQSPNCFPHLIFFVVNDVSSVCTAVSRTPFIHPK